MTGSSSSGIQEDFLQGKQWTLREAPHNITSFKVDEILKIHILIATDIVTEAENSIKINSILEENYLKRMVT